MCRAVLLLNDHTDTQWYKYWLLQSFHTIYLIEQEFSEFRYIFSFLSDLHKHTLSVHPFIKSEKADRDLTCTSEQVKELIQGWLNSGNLISLQLNKFYLPCAAEYHKIKLNHRVVIYGYDDGTGIFQAADTFKNMRFSFEELTYEDFFSAYAAYDEGHNKEGAELELISIRQGISEFGPKEWSISLMDVFNRNISLEYDRIVQMLIDSFDDDKLLDENSLIVLVEYMNVLGKKIEILRDTKMIELTVTELETFEIQRNKTQQFFQYYRKSRIKNRLYHEFSEKDLVIEKMKELYENYTAFIKLVIRKLGIYQEDGK